MELSIISRDTIKPSLDSSSLKHVSPFKLSLVDQLTPATYMPLILFYPMVPISDPKSSFNLLETLTRLKSSLSETLTLYYPFSGRAKNNLYIHDFDTGIPFLEARVNCRMLDFLKLQETELLNRFVPFQPICKETDDESLLPMIAFQVNVFACGGTAIGGSASHKLCDGLAVNSILESWAAIFRGELDKDICLCLISSVHLTLPKPHLSFHQELCCLKSI
ncbi:stemmadenine O-acetyltransferase-like [Rosa rugosa]|uniref:stemmadenine O-acetyltransferase-like n=1 Tax=Rosa rugosa TaxID=74645 RepID=UPI002B40B420|nr:stemmadenine O-acetyltransferase-like [Rosa rugosa]